MRDRYWIFHVIAGLLLFLFLGVHMVTMHLGSITGLFVAHSDVAPTALVNSHARDAHVGFTVAYVALLGLGLFHGLYGLRTILFELSLRPATRRVVTVALLALGLGLFGLGSWANLVAHARAVTVGG